MFMSRLSLALALMLLALVDASALQTTLTWKVGKDTVIFNESIKVTEKGISAVIASSIGEYDTLVMDENRSTLEWRRKVAAENTDIEAVRTGSHVRIKGTYKGKPYDARINFDNLPWYQFQEISYEQFFAAKAASVSFWTIDRKTLKPSEFRAEKRESESITIMGNPVMAIKYDLTVKGVPSFLFKAHFWIRETDGRFLKLAVPPLFDLPRSVVELSRES